jgi:hypothetical protein
VAYDTSVAAGGTNSLYSQRIELLRSEIQQFIGGRYVDSTSTNATAPYTSWATAAVNIQDAVNAAGANETIWIAEGTYTLPTNHVVNGGTNVVYIDKPLTLLAVGNVVIDGEGAYRGVCVKYGFTDVFAFATLDGITITNGYASEGGAIWYDSGSNYKGAMQAKLLNCLLVDNVAATNGGAVYTYHIGASFPLTLLMSNCVVRGNQALDGEGGGVCWKTFGPATITDSLFEENAANGSGVRGGGLSVSQNSTAITIDRTIFRGNTLTSSTSGSYGGGGAYFRICTVTMRNSLFVDNHSNRRGGALYFYYKPKLTMENCTIASNGCGQNGSAAIDLGGTSATTDLVRFNNNIIYNNLRGSTTANVFLSSDLDLKTYATNNCTTPSTVWTNFTANGNITNEAAFVDLTALDLHLTTDSPCRDTGTNLPWMAWAVDLGNTPRIAHGVVDRGCYEYSAAGMIFMVW